jgi:hypothetical protein
MVKVNKKREGKNKIEGREIIVTFMKLIFSKEIEISLTETITCQTPSRSGFMRS